MANFFDDSTGILKLIRLPAYNQLAQKVFIEHLLILRGGSWRENRRSSRGIDERIWAIAGVLSNWFSRRSVVEHHHLGGCQIFGLLFHARAQWPFILFVASFGWSLSSTPLLRSSKERLLFFLLVRKQSIGMNLEWCALKRIVSAFSPPRLLLTYAVELRAI